ncbi:hypothetical protein DFH07DRAFT_459517 [Mycena maculata]|uniref:F-box domain-containing protein n=1 Tax=Mycena maculata TaxID=230809 RepID=A0AAD7NES3_9AGAR|nr:hypothetical protein DFH07DRAFT_459517 [Mycena maculata]
MDTNSDPTNALHDPRRIRIAQIDEKIAQLQAERHALIASFTFPVITLPVEITSEIFVRCLSDNPLDYSTTEVAVVLGHVCRRWRDIALSIPCLWAGWSLAIDRGTSLQQICAGIKLWLSRSKDRPLSIRLYHADGVRRDVDEEDEDWWERAWDFGHAVVPLLLEHQRRWKNIDFSVPVSILRSIPPLTQGHSDLTHLVLGSAERDWGGGGDEEVITYFALAPKLRSLHIVLEEHHLSQMDPVQLPYAQLTSFTGTMFSPMECAFILSLTPALVEGVFYLHDGDANMAHHVASPTTLSHLKSLKLWSTTARVRPVEALDYLTLPSLETLAFGCCKLTAGLWTFWERSDECAIRHFFCESMEWRELRNCLELMSELDTLELLQYDQQVVTDVMRRLHHHGELSSLLPELQSLTVHCHKKRHDGDFPFIDLLSLLEELVTCTPLQRFRLTWTSPLLPRRPNLEESARFRMLVAKGMDIYVGNQETSWI